MEAAERAAEYIVCTPLRRSPTFSEELAAEVYFKLENRQTTGSFKLRGATNRLLTLSPPQREQGCVAASSGNHGAAVACAMQTQGVSGVIFVPEHTSPVKIDKIRSYDGDVRLFGTDGLDTEEHARDYATRNGMFYLSPYNDEQVIAGQGTIADELLRQNPGRFDAIFVPVGGGGLISGIALYIKTLRPEITIIGVEPKDSAAMYHSLAAGRRITLDSVGIFADGVAVRKVGKLPFELCRKYVDGIIRVTTDELCGGIKAIYQSTRSIVEPAGGLGMTGLLKYIHQTGCRDLTLAAINSGANMNFERLRYVAERTRVGEKQEALFAVAIPEIPGSLKAFCRDMVGERNITEFNYRLSNRERAHIFVGISIHNEAERHQFADQLSRNGF